MMGLLKKSKRRSPGNIGDLLTMGLFVLAMAVVMITFIDCVGMLRIKDDVGQITRKYLLVMETEGYLTTESESKLINELSGAGLTNISLEGTTVSRVGFGNVITIKIRGKIKDSYEISEVRSSTAKY